MTLTLIEGFDWADWTVAKYESKDWSYTFTSFEGVDQWEPFIDSPRVLGHSFGIRSPGSNIETFRMQKILPGVLTHLVTGFGFKCSQYPVLGGSGAVIWRWTTPPGSDIVNLVLNPDLSLAIFNSSNTLIVSSAPGLFTVGAWHFIEAKIVVNGASSSVGLHLDGVEIIAPTTCNLGSTGVGWVGAWGESNNTGWNSPANGGVGVVLAYDDVYVLDTNVSPNNDYLGDCHVETLFPNGVGTHSDWTPDSGSTHYTRVNEKSGTYPDDDTSYVQSINVGDEDSYAYDDLTIISGTVYGVQTNLYARKLDTNLRQLKPVVVAGGTTYLGSSLFTLANGYVDGTEIMEVNPHTSAAWTVSEVNAAEFGVKIQT